MSENKILREYLDLRRKCNETGGIMRSFITYLLHHVIRAINPSRIKWLGHIAHIGEMRNGCNILDGKPEVKRSRHKQEDNIRMKLREIGWEVVDYIHLAQDKNQWWALVNTVMNLWVP
jgi:hypothetical protein